MENIAYYTEEGLEKLKAELNHLISVERPAISAAIAEARDKGDLSENAEYAAAKEAQSLLELKISQMQALIASARILDETKIDTSKILLHSKVELFNMKTKQKLHYEIVPESEADLRENKISVTSPIAKGLLGLRANDEAEITVPAGKLKFKILSVTRS